MSCRDSFDTGRQMAFELFQLDPLRANDGLCRDARCAWQALPTVLGNDFTRPDVSAQF